MKRLRRVTEAEVIAEFLKNEFYQGEFHRDREAYEKLVLEADLANDYDNALRRALLYRRRGHMWRELPADTQWWQVEFEPADLGLIRVFPRAQWRRVANGSFRLTDIVHRIKTVRFSGKTNAFISKVQSLSYHLRNSKDTSSVLLIGIDEKLPLTILEGNHRIAAAMLVSPDLLRTQFQVLCGFSQNMAKSCWYETNLANLWRYAQNRLRNFRYDPEADVERVRRLASSSAVAPDDSALDTAIGVHKAFPGPK
ncbi:MAG TPA: hypothetical protein VF135_11645 [Terriglobales bacterium]